MVDRQHSRPTGRDAKSTAAGDKPTLAIVAGHRGSCSSSGVGQLANYPLVLEGHFDLARYASTLPSLSCISNSDTSATLKSRNVLLARLIAGEAAYSRTHRPGASPSSDLAIAPSASMGRAGCCCGSERCASRRCHSSRIEKEPLSIIRRARANRSRSSTFAPGVGARDGMGRCQAGSVKPGACCSGGIEAPVAARAANCQVSSAFSNALWTKASCLSGCFVKLKYQSHRACA
jgi:hypothetical protein